MGAPELGEQGEVSAVLPPPVHRVDLGAAAAPDEPGDLQVDLVLQGDDRSRLGTTASSQKFSPAELSCAPYILFTEHSRPSVQCT